MLAECVRGEEGIDTGFRFTISCLSTDSNVALKSLLGQPALLQLLTATSREQMRPFHGHITGAEMSGSNGGLARYQLTVEPWTAFLGLGRDSRVFHDMSVFDILDAVFGGWQGKGCLVPEWRFDIAKRDIYPIRSLTTQYQESDFTFVQRLMAEEGLFHYFEHSGDPDSPALGSHLMVIADHNASFKPNSQATIEFTQASAVMKQDSLDRWRTELRTQASGLDIGSWDYRTRHSRPVGSVDPNPGAAPLTVREPLGGYAYETREQGQRMADNLMQGLKARKEVHIAAGTVRTLAPGTTFSLQGQAQLDASTDANARNFVVVRVVHLMHNNLSAELKAEVAHQLAPGKLAELVDTEQSQSLHAVGTQMGERPLYRVRIDAIASSLPYRGSRVDQFGALLFPKPTVQGQQSAIVVGPAGSVIHTDRDHRIKVQFHWQRGTRSHSRLEHPSEGHTGAPADDSAGTWVRVATPMAPVAGANWGSNALPRVGQEVLIDFIEGDIDRPVVIGALYNGRGQQDNQVNQISQGGGASTGNAPAWFSGEGGAHAHPAVLSGIKTQAMNASQSGGGAYSQLVMDDSPAQSRMSLQRHAGAHRGTDELNLGSLRHQSDNQRLQAAGFGAELKTEHHVAMRAGQGMLLSTHARVNASGGQLDAREASMQTQSALDLQKELSTVAQKHTAKLLDELGNAEPEPEKLSASQGLSAHITALDNSTQSMASSGETGGNGQATAFSQPIIQLASPSGIVAATPASAVVVAGLTTSISAGQDINLAAQGNSYLLVSHGISLFTYGKASAKEKPNQELGIMLHAASGKVSSQSQDGETRITADKAITVASVTKAVTVGAHKHLLFTAQGAMLKLEGGNIMLHGPGKIEFKASLKELAGPKDSRASMALPKGELKSCPTKG